MLTESIQTDAVAAFFDSRAPQWDAKRSLDRACISRLLDIACIGWDSRLLDIGCGTGVLVPFALERGVSRYLGIDVSEGMISRARMRLTDARVRFMCGDAERLSIDPVFNRVMVFNALPHFPSPEALVASLTALMPCESRLTIAHDMGRKKLDDLHNSRAHSVSRGLPPAEELALIMEKFLSVDTVLDTDEAYAVSGVM